MGVVKVLVDQLKQVAGEIANFFKKIWDGLRTAYNAVAGAVETAVDFIRGIFGDVMAPTWNGRVGQHTSGDTHNGNGFGGPVVSFVGRLNRPAAVGLFTATAGLAYVTEQLLQHKVIYTSYTVETVDKSGKTVIETKTSIGPMKSSTSRLGSDDLKQI